MWAEITPEEMNALRAKVIVDVRSPCEHEMEKIPGSINVPLLSDHERAIVGTIYAKEGEIQARRKALEMVAPRAVSLTDSIVSLRKPGHTLIVHCWRGGLRSQAVAGFLSLIGISAFRLVGGYRAWRGQVLKDFADPNFVFDAVVLDGLTGVGKTDLLGVLSGIGCQVLDMEELANHRGSVFGAIGLPSQPTQKNFDAALWTRLRALKPGPVFLEGESRKIGRLALPENVLKSMNSGRRILVTASLQSRKDRLIAEYRGCADEKTKEEAVGVPDRLRERLGNKLVSEIGSLVESGSLDAAVEALLLNYYDPLYRHNIAKQAEFHLRVCADDLDNAAKQIKSWLEKGS